LPDEKECIVITRKVWRLDPLPSNIHLWFFNHKVIQTQQALKTEKNGLGKPNLVAAN